MPLLITFIFIFILFALRSFLIIWDVEFLVFLFFLVLSTTLVLLLRYAILKSVTLKISFIHSLLSVLLNLNLKLLNKLLEVTSYIRFRYLYFTPLIFIYYCIELLKIFSMRLIVLFSHRVKTFLFFFLQSLFLFEGKISKRILSSNLTFNLNRLKAVFIKTELVSI